MDVEQTGRKQSAMALPLPFQIARTGLNGLGRVSPPLAGRLAYHLFCTPFRYAEPPRETAVLLEAERFSIPFQDSHLAAYAWGQGPTVLLVHGWSGRGSQLGAFVEPLVAAGHRVVAFDLPAHGRTPGRRTNALVAAEAVLRVGEAIGSLRGVIAHSFGALCTTLALRDGLDAGRVVYVAPASRASQAVHGFSRQFGLSWPVEWGLRGEMERRFGPGIWPQFSARACAPRLNVPALIFHDLDDAEVPYREGQLLAHSWPGARLVTLAGLGHRRILRDERVIGQAVDFLRAARIPSASVA
jgi:pimeloyl-ACP methyl ester carboxylesterase